MPRGFDATGLGWVEVMTSPEVSAATQNDALAQETVVSADVPGSLVEFP